MPSFDVVSEVDKHELSNAVDQANRELSTRRLAVLTCVVWKRVIYWKTWQARARKSRFARGLNSPCPRS